MKPRIRSLTLLGLGLALALGPSLSAQTTGTIYGQVSDPTGAALPEANITAQNTATGLERKAVSNPVGSYLVPSLPPGPYKVTVEHAGFTTYVQTGITMIVGENARVDAALQVGAVAQKVEVSASAMRVDSQSTTVGTTVDNRRVQSMPLNGRNVLALTQLLPGVGNAAFPTQVLFGRTGTTVNISGARQSQNNLMLDGSTMVNHVTNVMTNLPSPDALQEFRVLTNSYSAEYGRASGGVLLAVTKSGTNEFHGSLYEYLRNDALNARNFFAGAQKPMLRQNQFGGSIGGPVILPGYNGRDRTFFFFNYQGLRIRQQSILTTFPPTAQERQGIFAKPITDPTTGQPFPNNTIPTARFDPLAVGLLNTYIPLPTQPDGTYRALLSLPTDGNAYTVKVDHQFSASDRLSVRFYRDLGIASNLNSSSFITRGLSGSQSNLTQTESLTYSKVLSPRLLNEFTFSHLRTNTGLSPGPGAKSPRELGGNFNYDGPVPAPPRVTAIGRFSFAPLINVDEIEDTYFLSDKLTWTHGRHSVKAGTDLQLRGQNISRAAWVGPAPSFTFSGAFTGDALADYLIGRPLSIQALGYREDIARSSGYHFFVQDDFKINPRLTLNLGLRYELNTPWANVQGHSATIIPGKQSQKFPNAPPGLVYPGDPGVPPGLIPTDKNNWQPRIGFAWDPTGKGRTAIRAAFAVYTNYSGAWVDNNTNANAPFSQFLQLVVAPPSFSDPWNVAHGGIDPYPYVFTPGKATFTYPLSIASIAPDFRDGYLEQWNFNIQHEFGPPVLIKAGYYGLVGHKLYNGWREVNQPVYGPGATLANLQSRRPFLPQYYGSIGQMFSNDNSNYHALQASVDKKFSRGYTFQLAYTFSKSIDTSTGGGPQDANNTRRGERGLSDFDQRHILAVNGIWELPFMKQNRFLGGWQLAGLTRITSGLPFSIYSGCDCALTGAATSQRADLVGGRRLDPNRSHGQLVAAYFDKSAFAQPPIGKFGSSGRNIVIGPGYADTDLSLQKSFRLPRERGAIQFRADFFNLFNQVNFNNPTNTFTSPAFGRLLSAKDARIVQLALRFDF